MKVRLKIQELMQQKSQQIGRNLTATDIAKELGVSHHTIFSYIRNQRSPSMEMIGKLCLYFNCTIADLMVLEELSEEDEEPQLMAV